jgi:hypothetical protein
MSSTTEPKTFMTIAARYTAVWNEPDAILRRCAIAELWASSGVEFVEGTQFRGHNELDARIAHAYTEFVGSGKYIVTCTDDITCHQDIVMFTIQLVSPGDGEVAWAARVFLILDDNALIREDYQLTVRPLAA